jgi:hypothetical protein
VSLMSRIYSQAKQTFVWLGPEAENSNAAMSFLKDLWHTKMSNADIVNKHKQLLSIADLAVAVTSLFQRPCWSRLWIVQEFWLSPCLTFLCGASVLHFHDNCVPRARAYFLSQISHRYFSFRPSDLYIEGWRVPFVLLHLSTSLGIDNVQFLTIKYTV